MNEITFNRRKTNIVILTLVVIFLTIGYLVIPYGVEFVFPTFALYILTEFFTDILNIVVSVCIILIALNARAKTMNLTLVSYMKEGFKTIFSKYKKGDFKITVKITIIYNIVLGIMLLSSLFINDERLFFMTHLSLICNSFLIGDIIGMKCFKKTSS